MLISFPTILTAYEKVHSQQRYSSREGTMGLMFVI